MDRKKIILFNEIVESSSSSSSSDSDDDNMYIILSVESKERPKIKEFEAVVNNYSDEEFRRHFRVKRSTYRKLNTMFENSTFYPKARCHGRCDLTSSSVCTLAFLWYAGNKCCLRDVASRFGIGDSTVFRAVENVMKFLVDIAPQIIKFPEDKAQLAEQFRRISGFLDCLGCIDGTFIPIRTPYHKIKSTYVNRHDQPALTLQAICDYRKVFLDVFTGIPSKIHDARVYRLSFISKKLEAICQGGRYHIVGDAAYPIKKWLQTPYRNYGNMTNAEKIFNKKLSKCRVKIENAFGLLKNRWRQLIKTEFGTVLKTANFIIACCVLEWNDEWEEENCEGEENVVEPEYNNAEQQEKREGEEKRRLLTEILNR